MEIIIIARPVNTRLNPIYSPITPTNAGPVSEPVYAIVETQDKAAAFCIVLCLPNLENMIGTIFAEPNPSSA